MRLLDAEVRRHGARLLVAYVPSKMEVDRREWGPRATALRDRSRGADRGPRRASARRRGGGRRDSPVLDLTDALVARRRGGHTARRLPNRDGGHWNEAGHAAAARAIGERVAR